MVASALESSPYVAGGPYGAPESSRYGAGGLDSHDVIVRYVFPMISLRC